MYSQSAPPPQSRNAVLNALPAADFASIKPYLKTIAIEQGEELVGFGEKMTEVYFPQSGLISLVVRLMEGNTVEVALVGRSSIFGASAASDGQISLITAIGELSGSASTLAVSQLRLLADQNAAFRTILIRHQQALFVQAQQSAGCLGSHSVEARMATWLLRIHDMGHYGSLPLTREFIGHMLGVHRNAVSTAAQMLQKAGLIRYDRGRVEIVNLLGLKQVACECYAIVKVQYDRLMKADVSEADRRSKALEDRIPPLL
jgi:CRP-like cAMP-binding protein